MAEAALELLLADLRGRRAGARRASSPSACSSHAMIIRESSGAAAGVAQAAQAREKRPPS